MTLPAGGKARSDSSPVALVRPPPGYTACKNFSAALEGAYLLEDRVASRSFAFLVALGYVVA